MAGADIEPRRVPTGNSIDTAQQPVCTHGTDLPGDLIVEGGGDRRDGFRAADALWVVQQGPILPPSEGNPGKFLRVVGGGNVLVVVEKPTVVTTH